MVTSSPSFTYAVKPHLDEQELHSECTALISPFSTPSAMASFHSPKPMAPAPRPARAAAPAPAARKPRRERVLADMSPP